MYQNIELYIDGCWTPASDGGMQDVIDPCSEQVLGSICSATAADLDNALDAAQKGFDVWRQLGTWERAQKIRCVADLIRQRVDTIAMTMSLETGKPLVEAKGETNAAADQFEWYSEETKRIYGQIIGSRTSESRLSVIYQPVGVVAAFTAWNFPALLPARKIAASLAAGCSIIIKPASEAPGSCVALVQACHDGGIPPGVVNFVTGQSSMISRHLIASSIVRKVSVTGSVDVGKQILRLAADGVKKVSMELGGHAPVIVFDDADAVAAAKTCAATKFRNCGQVCISPTRFYVHADSVDAFATAFAEVAESLKIGAGQDPDTQMGPLANARGLQSIENMVSDAVSKGARVLTGGHRPKQFNAGFYFEPTVLTQVPDSARIMNQEPFGPVAPITTFNDYDEVMARANSLPFGLAGYIFTRDIGLATRASEDLQVGMVGINEVLLAAAEAPFGGIKESGMGREGGSLGIHDYLVPKYIKMKF